MSAQESLRTVYSLLVPAVGRQRQVDGSLRPTWSTQDCTIVRLFQRKNGGAKKEYTVEAFIIASI